MNDRELLELAAKAAGIVKFWDGDTSCAGAASDFWNPLTDDGDALRLAVKLEFQVIIYSDWVEVLQDGIRKTNADSVYDAGCMLTCTRRAIVQAAAEIGKSL